mgnify:CR=1 FL=1|jgi:hypothetical protein
MIVCGWCGHPTDPATACGHCGRDPGLPYEQRGTRPPDARRAMIAKAEAMLRASGERVTDEAIGEALGRDGRTIRRWRQQMAGNVPEMTAGRPRTPTAQIGD